MAMKKYIMESLGVFALCYIGGMSILNCSDNGGVALAHMLALGIMIYVGAATSGSNFNPAVSLALLFTKNLRCVDCLMYILFQFLGGFLGGFLIWGIHGGKEVAEGGMSDYCKTFPSFPSQGKHPVLGANETGGQYTGRIFQACFAEFFATFFLVFMVFGTALETTSKTRAYGFCIAGAVGMSALGIGTITGGAMNPMRWAGPWVVSLWGCDGGNQSGWGWLVYGVFTCLGGITAGITYRFLYWIPA